MNGPIGSQAIPPVNCASVLSNCQGGGSTHNQHDDIFDSGNLRRHEAPHLSPVTESPPEVVAPATDIVISRKCTGKIDSCAQIERVPEASDGDRHPRGYCSAVAQGARPARAP